ncbi:MAG: M20/M25/M40 family metallo-hydrolase, partial [Lachnospiraceae bacterium]|nr:M20/M25/M40 family metallo-hydrolase [Candidatus Hippenecus merdae]
MELLDKIRKYIDDHENEMVEELMELCAIDSVCGEPKPGAPFGPGPKKALDKAGEICEKYGLRTANYDNRVCTADFGGSEPALDVIAHVDVVPAGEGWVVTRPFSPMVRDGRVYGRGTADDKCGVIV